MLLKLDSLFSRLKSLGGKKGVVLFLIMFGAGLILLLAPETKSETSGEPQSGVISSEEYCALLEKKAESLINELSGVKDCRVFITLESGYQYIYATDQHIREESSGKQTDKTIVLANGEKGENAILLLETMPKVSGIAVVCSGASYETQYRIIELLCALFDIKSNRISVQS